MYLLPGIDEAPEKPAAREADTCQQEAAGAGRQADGAAAGRQGQPPSASAQGPVAGIKQESDGGECGGGGSGGVSPMLVDCAYDSSSGADD